jgi:thymidylate kinase
VPREEIAPWIVVSGLDGAGKTAVTERLAEERGGHLFRLPYHEFVNTGLALSGDGSPFGDVHTDRLIFAVDARLTNYLVKQWRRVHSLVISQRGWMDGFIFAAVQGLSYEETDAMLRTSDLERPTAIVYLIADPEVAYQRIRIDPERDKYETRPFLVSQHRATLNFVRAVGEGHPALASFAQIPSTLIDTTALEESEVFRRVEEFLSARHVGKTRALKSS